MREGTSHTGIEGANQQDIAVEESMGAIYDRSKEHLGTSDIAVIRMRRLLIDSAKAFERDGTTPIGLGEGVNLAELRAEEDMLPLGESWERMSPHGDASRV